MIKYGLISDTDARVLEKTIDLINNEFKEGTINFCEIGVYSGMTAIGLYDYTESIRRCLFTTGIDSGKDGEKLRFLYNNFIKGNSTEVYNQLEDDSQHLLFIDGDHSLIGVISDFYAYADKVKVGGFLAFHDTGKHIKPFKDFQHGDKDNPDAYISVRKALKRIGLLDIKMLWYAENGSSSGSETKNGGWELIFDEADETNEAGGLTVFKRLY